MWLLDSNTWIRYMNSAPSRVKEQMKLHPPTEILLCDVVKAELYYGAYKSQRVAQNLALLSTLFAQFHSLPFDSMAAQIFGQIRANLAKKGTPIGPYDLQIAAIALSNQVTLVTHNTDEFGRIAGLQLEDWE